eukprot:757906-Hanusia_phi.AAC.1
MAKDLKGTVKEILGTAFSVGCTVAGKSPKQIQEDIDSGESARDTRVSSPATTSTYFTSPVRTSAVFTARGKKAGGGTVTASSAPPCTWPALPSGLTSLSALALPLACRGEVNRRAEKGRERGRRKSRGEEGIAAPAPSPRHQPRACVGCFETEEEQRASVERPVILPGPPRCCQSKSTNSRSRCSLAFFPRRPPLAPRLRSLLSLAAMESSSPSRQTRAGGCDVHGRPQQRSGTPARAEGAVQQETTRRQGREEGEGRAREKVTLVVRTFSAASTTAFRGVETPCGVLIEPSPSSVSSRSSSFSPAGLPGHGTSFVGLEPSSPCAAPASRTPASPPFPCSSPAISSDQLFAARHTCVQRARMASCSLLVLLGEHRDLTQKLPHVLAGGRERNLPVLLHRPHEVVRRDVERVGVVKHRLERFPLPKLRRYQLLRASSLQQ